MVQSRLLRNHEARLRRRIFRHMDWVKQEISEKWRRQNPGRMPYTLSNLPEWPEERDSEL